MTPVRTRYDGLRAGAVAGVLSGVPSTAYALLAGRDPLEASLAAGTLLLPHEQRRGRLLVAGLGAHVAISLGWGVVLARVLPRRPPLAAGALAGAAIAGLDLGVLGRRFPAVRRLPLGPQVADHLAYGLVVAAVLQGRSRNFSPVAIRP